MKMTRTEEKTMHFVSALADVYKDADHRELDAFGAIKFSDDVTEDFTAMLIAMNLIFDRIVGSDGDLIDFTHLLNRLAIQHIMDKNTPCQGELEFDYEAEDDWND